MFHIVTVSHKSKNKSNKTNSIVIIEVFMTTIGIFGNVCDN